jgi:regulation of enolase protein 1 (concanavalin A-like superfamily)
MVELDDGSLEIEVAPKTDFWRKTHDGGVRDNGHFYFETIAGDFLAQVKVRGDYREKYDQAGLMARVDATTWLKCGIEYCDGIPLASAVVTRDWSDWSVVPLEEPTTCWRLRREQNTFEIEYSLDGETFQKLRQCHLTEAPEVDVGLMACSPLGRGFRAVFSERRVERR